MASPSHLFRVVNEFVFMLVGALLVLFALTGRYLFNPRRPGWIALSARAHSLGTGNLAPSPSQQSCSGPAGREDRGRLAVAGGIDYALSRLGAVSMGWMALAGHGRHLRAQRLGFRGNHGSVGLNFWKLSAKGAGALWIPQ